MKNHSCGSPPGLRAAPGAVADGSARQGRAGSALVCNSLHTGTERTAATFRVHFYFPLDAAVQLLHQRNPHIVNPLYGWCVLFTVIGSVRPFACSSVPPGSEPWQQLWSILLLISAIFLHEALQAGCSSWLFLQVLIYFSSQPGKLFFLCEINRYNSCDSSVFQWFGRNCLISQVQLLLHYNLVFKSKNNYLFIAFGPVTIVEIRMLQVAVLQLSTCHSCKSVVCFFKKMQN